MQVGSSSVQPDVPAQLLAQLLASGALESAAAERLSRYLARDGHDLASLVTEGGRLPLRCFLEAYPELDGETAAVLGYTAGEQARLTSFSQLSLPLVSAGSVSEALHLLEFIPLISSSLTARFVTRCDDIVIMLTANSGDAVLDRFPVFYSAAALGHVLSFLVADAPALTVHIAWPMPAAFKELPEVVAGRLRFDAPMHHIVVPRSSLEAVCRFSDPIAYRSAVSGLEAKLAALRSRDDLSTRLRALLDAPAHLLSIDDAARQLHLSSSTLKRRLAERGTRFSTLRDQVLKERALLLMADASLNLDAVATELGYSDITNFSHAFKRWTGQSPGVYRRALTNPVT